MSASSPPSISVIIVCKDPGARLSTAMESIWAQKGATSELIIVDGASTDGTREWLESRRHLLATLISEPDNGIYDAMNKGVAVARNTWVLFLGSDDRLATPTTLADASVTLAQTPAAIVSGKTRFDDGRLYSFAGKTAAIRRNFVHHQATFYRRALFSKHGGFDASLRLQADYEHNLRLLRAGESFQTVPLLVADCASGGLSDSGRWANYREEIAVRHRHFPAWRCWPWDTLAVVRYGRKKIVRNFASS